MGTEHEMVKCPGFSYNGKLLLPLGFKEQGEGLQRKLGVMEEEPPNRSCNQRTQLLSNHSDVGRGPGE